MNTKRRSFLWALGAGVVAIPVSALTGSGLAGAAETPKLDPQETTAALLKYTHNSQDSAKKCSGCQFFTQPGDDWGPCTIFPGRLVSAEGACDSWYARA